MEIAVYLEMKRTIHLKVKYQQFTKDLYPSIEEKAQIYFILSQIIIRFLMVIIVLQHFYFSIF